MTENELKDFARQIRIETLKEIGARGFGHIGGSISIVDLLAVLYGEIMKIDPINPNWEDRDWLVVSKGHAGPAVYAALALKGYFPLEYLSTLNQNNTCLPSHCDRNKTVGIDMTTGSLGQGASTAAGVALGHKIDGKNNYTYLILGDGECNEGQVWEAALFSAQHVLDHLIAFVDYNKKQLDGFTKDICDLGELEVKFANFGWDSQRVNGHDVNAIKDAIDRAKTIEGKPHMIVLDTVKGKGCYFAENEFSNHHMNVTEEQIQKAIQLLQAE